LESSINDGLDWRELKWNKGNDEKIIIIKVRGVGERHLNFYKEERRTSSSSVFISLVEIPSLGFPWMLDY